MDKGGGKGRGGSVNSFSSSSFFSWWKVSERKSGGRFCFSLLNKRESVCMCVCALATFYLLYNLPRQLFSLLSFSFSIS